MSIGMVVAGLIAGHLATSFVQTFTHRAFGHGAHGGWIRKRHVTEHHGIYSGDRLLQPRYSEQEKSLSKYGLIPTAVVVPMTFLLFPLAFAGACLAGIALSYLAHIYLHAQYHLSDALFRNQAWFRRLQALHMVHHHRQNRNYAVIDLYWDKLVGTFASAEASGSGETQ